MSNWNEMLDARHRGDVEGFHGADEPIDSLDPEDQPAVESPAGSPAPAARARKASKASKKRA